MVASTIPKSPTYHGNKDVSSAWVKVSFSGVPFLTIGKGGVLATGGKKNRHLERNRGRKEEDLADGRAYLGAQNPQVLGGYIKTVQDSPLIRLDLDFCRTYTQNKTTRKILFWSEAGRDFHLRDDIS